MSKTLKLTVVLVSVGGAFIAGMFLGESMTRVDIPALSACLEPYAGNVTLKDSAGADQQVTVVVANQIGACIESN